MVADEYPVALWLVAGWHCKYSISENDKDTVLLYAC